MTKEKIDEMLEMYGNEMLTMDGFDDCIIGIVERCSEPTIFCYSTEKVIEKLMKDDGMTREEAEEFFAFNQLGAWMGDTTPCFLSE